MITPPLPEDEDGTTRVVLEEQIKEWRARVFAVETQPYVSALAILNAMYAEDPEFQPITEQDEVGVGDAGDPTLEVSLADVLNGFEEEGIWGFTDSDCVIHYWHNPEKCTPEHRVDFWAHELSHAVLEPLLNAFSGGLNEELLANVVGAIAVRSARL